MMPKWKKVSGCYDDGYYPAALVAAPYRFIISKE